MNVPLKGTKIIIERVAAKLNLEDENPITNDGLNPKTVCLIKEAMSHAEEETTCKCPASEGYATDIGHALAIQASVILKT